MPFPNPCNDYNRLIFSWLCLIFVSVNDFLPVKMEYQSPGFGKRWPTEDQRLFYNYHQIAGVQIPFKTVRFSNGFKSGETHLESARINSDLPDTLFVPKK